MPKKNNNISGFLIRVLSYLTPYPKYLIFILVCLMMTTILNFFQPLLLKKITDTGLVQQDLQVLYEYVILMFVLILIGQIIGITQTKIFAELHNKVTYAIYKQAFRKVFRLDSSYFSDRNSSEIIGTIQTDVSNIASITDTSILDVISLIFRVISGLAGLLTLSWKLTFIVVCMIPVKYFLIRHLSNKENQIVEKQIENYRSFSSWFSDNVSGVKEVKLWGLHHRIKKSFEQRQKRILKLSKQQSMLKAWNSFTDTILAWIISGSLYAFGGILIVQGKMTVGGVFAFISYSNYVINPISSIFNIKLILADIIPSAKRLFTFLDMKEEQSSSWLLTSKAYKIEMKDVCFSYNNERKVIQHLNLSINPGEKIAIIGSNGSGKTTIINLLLRFLSPQKGHIFINGFDIKKTNLVDYRKKFAVVSQNPYLFSDTIKNNINLDGSANNREIWDACQKSHSNTFIDKLPDKENSYIGQNGAKLSGGEKQKLAIARAIIKNSPIIILDEASANFDKESDSYLNRLINTEMQGKTLLMVTHDYENLQYFDHIFKIDKGSLSEVSLDEISSAK